MRIPAAPGLRSARRARRPLVEVAIALIERRGRYLICRRPRGVFLGGCWEFPGGKRKPREPWVACLRRELREELGVSICRIRPAGGMRHRYPDRDVRLRIFRCAIAQGRPRALQVAAVRWVPRSRLLQHAFPPANQVLLARLGEV